MEATDSAGHGTQSTTEAAQTATDGAATGAAAGDQFDFMVVSNRLPVDRCSADEAGCEDGWRRSPGGLVTALAPMMTKTDGAWVGWHGAPDETVKPFSHGGIDLIPVQLSTEDIELFYEGFSNATLWPLYHDVIAPPEFHRTWWDSYRKVNRRFADAVIRHAAEGATVWVQDYQLQLVPEAAPGGPAGPEDRVLQPHPLPAAGDLRPAPVAPCDHRRPAGRGPGGLPAQQRRRKLHALRPALPGRQRQAAAGPCQGRPTARPPTSPGPRRSRSPLTSSRSASWRKKPEVIERAQQIRRDLGNPKTILLGVDRLDYTKGIRHRLKAYEELLQDGKVTVEDATLIQVASPSRERVEQYRLLREEVEGTVGHINGTFDTMESTAVRYLHHSYPIEEMVSLYLAADVMLVTALRDGMNLVAKEYVTARTNNDGALVLSEFAGAADQLKQALLMNPHDIDGLKDTIMRAVNMQPAEASRRMRAMRKQILDHDVDLWSSDFLAALAEKVVRDDS